MGRGRTCPCLLKAHFLPRPPLATGTSPLCAKALGLSPLVTSHCLLCPQTDTSDPEKVVSAFLKVSSVFKDEATVRSAVQDAVGTWGGWGPDGSCLSLLPGLGSEHSPLTCSSTGFLP